jgi:hypothetical protein
MAQVHAFLDAGPTGTVLNPAPAAAVPIAAADVPVEWDRTQLVTSAVPPVPSTTPSPARRRPGPAALLIGGSALLLLLIVLWATFAGGEGNNPADDVTPVTPTSSDAAGAQPTADGMEQFIEDYLSTVTSDPETTYAMLTPAFQEQSGGLDGYEGFWSTIESADLQSVSADPQDLTVRYTVHYTRTDGSQVTNDVTLQLVYEHGDYLIAGEA